MTVQEMQVANAAGAAWWSDYKDDPEASLQVSSIEALWVALEELSIDNQAWVVEFVEGVAAAAVAELQAKEGE